VRVEVQRGPDRSDTFSQELLLDDTDLKISLQVPGRDFPITRIDERTTLRPDSLMVWYLWPDRWYEVGAFFSPRGTFLGHYVNLIRPPHLDEPTLEGDRSWMVEDLFLDVWVPASGSPVILDRDELETAVSRGWVSGEERTRVEKLAVSIVARASIGSGGLRRSWPPPALRRWPPDLVPALRLKRDSPGTFFAARLSGRIIAYGLYLMGVVSATSIVFAWLTDAFVTAGPAQVAWLSTVAVEAVILLPAALGGWLPATSWPRPALTDERSLFVATLASGLAVLTLNERASWAGALLPVYGTLGLFSAIFAVCRARFDRAIPAFAIAGLLVTLAALVVLL